MPIFEYSCLDCHHDFEALTRSSQQPECPRCHSIQLEKKLSMFATASSGSAAAAAAMAAGPCGTCGHPDGPGSCGLPARH